MHICRLLYCEQCLDKTGKPGNSDIGLGLGNKIKDRVRVKVHDRARDWYRVRNYGLVIGLGLGSCSRVVLTFSLLSALVLTGNHLEQYF